jgi:uncharacterized membrane protein (DUF4010 family)
MIGWALALIAALSFAAYLAVRLLGSNRALLVTALLGGLTSSTAVTAILACYSAREPRATSTALAGIVLACSMMIVRIIVLLTVIAPSLASQLALPLGVAGASGLALGVMATWRAPCRSAALRAA